MAISSGYSFSATELVTSAKLNQAVNSATISGIVNAEIASNAAIGDTKLAQITTASKVSGAAVTSLSSVPTGAGFIPNYNINSDSFVTYEETLISCDGNLVFSN